MIQKRTLLATLLFTVMWSQAAFDQSKAAAEVASVRGWGAALTEETNLLLHAPDEVVIEIACRLDNPLDLLRLTIAFKRCWVKTVASPGHDGTKGTPEMWSMVSERARRWLAVNSHDGPEIYRPKAPPSAWLGLMHGQLKAREEVIVNSAREAIAMRRPGRRGDRPMTYKQLTKEVVSVVKQEEWKSCRRWSKLRDDRIARLATNYIARAFGELGT